jgi:hypothetical protein
MNRRIAVWIIVFVMAAAVGILAVYIGDGPEWYQLYDAVRDFLTDDV